ncbi:MAG: methyltransferase RsmF C-terminal domain-like protein [Marinifilaceae bacterium]
MISIPPLFKEDIKNLLDNEAEYLLNAIENEAKTSIRRNPVKCAKSNAQPCVELCESAVLWCEDGIFLTSRPQFTLDPLLHAGAYYVQEASSMFLHHVMGQLNMPEAPRVLDLCAAPGGKSTLLSTFVGENGLVVSNEVIRPRASILRENMIKWGLSNVVVTGSDPAAFTPLTAAFDVIVVDAPCSGEGMFRKDAAAREEWSPQNVALCADRQKRILADVWNALKPGGYLVYGTCTFNHKENEEVVEWLTTEFDATSVPVTHNFPDITPAIKSDIHGYHFFPHKTRGEGLFMAVVQKNSGEEYREPGKNKKQNKKSAPVTLPKELAALLSSSQTYVPFAIEDTIGVVPAQHAAFIERLASQLRILYKGCELAEVAGKKLKMKHAFAVSSLLNVEAVPHVELSLREALVYLKKGETPAEGLPNGWCIVTYNKVPLGWIKVIGNRANNYYPKEWRILMELPSE